MSTINFRVRVMDSEAIDFLAKNFSIIPIAPKNKFPCELKIFPWGAKQYNPASNWQRFSKQRPTPEEIELWKTWEGIGIGIPLGELNGLVALDLDNDTDNLHAQILSIVPDSPVKKKGAKGFTAFYKYTGDIPHKLSWNKDGVRVAEVLSQGQQTVVEGDHPQGMQYQWLGPRLGEAELPPLTLEHVSAINALFPETKPVARPVFPFVRPTDKEIPI